VARELEISRGEMESVVVWLAMGGDGW
jgi:hypothetical protein